MICERMRNLIRKSDAPLLGLVLPACNFIPAEVVSNSVAYQKMVAMVPSGLSWALAGFSVALWLFYPWAEKPRTTLFWKWLTDKFVIEHLAAGHWSKWDEQTDPMPQTDIGVRLRIRFIRSGKFKLRLRLFACTGQGRKPFHHVIPLGTITASKGQTLDIPVVDFGLPEPGWDHLRKRGWGPKREHSLIGRSKNVVVFECEGRLTQSHRFFVEMVNHDRGLGKHKPSLYIQDEDDDIWSVSADQKAGEWKYGG